SDVSAAEFRRGRSLPLDGSAESRGRFREARVRRARLAWISPRQDGSVVAISPDGRLCVLKENDHPLRLWDLGRHVETLRLPEDGGGTPSVAFRADGGQLAPGAEGGEIRTWAPG